MRKIKYSKNNIDFTKDLRSSVKDYFIENNIQPYGNRKILIKTFFMTLVYFIPLGFMVSGNVTSVPLVLLCWIIMGLGMSGLGMVTMHDANHGTFSKYKWVNNLFGKSLYLLGGYPPNWKYQHNTLHHGYTNIEGHDEDIGHGGVLRFSPHKPVKKIHKFQHIYAWFLYGLMTISWIVTKDFNKLNKYKKMGATLDSKGNFTRMFTELVISKVVYYGIFLILPLLLVPVSWYWIVTGFIAMHFTSGLVLSTIFQTAHVVPSSEFPIPDDDSQIQTNWAAHQLYTTSDFSPDSRIFSWFIGGLNYQIEHHLFPNISHIHYKNIAKIVKDTAQKHGLPYYVNKTFLQAVNEHHKMLKLLGNLKSESLQVQLDNAEKYNSVAV